VDSSALLPAAEFVAAEPVAVATELVEQNNADEVASSPSDAAGTEQAKVVQPEEPAFIEVWRPGGHSDRRPARPRKPRPVVQPVAATPAAAAAAPSAAAETPAPSHKPPHAFEKQHGQRRPPPRRPNQPNRGDRQDRHDRPRSRKRDDGPDRAEREQYYAKPAGSRSDRRDKPADPNSPFAKLAALKQQLEQNAKERP
jgi:ATP-dependent RNA helicase SUPV3L1/SUV3